VVCAVVVGAGIGAFLVLDRPDDSGGGDSNGDGDTPVISILETVILECYVDIGKQFAVSTPAPGTTSWPDVRIDLSDGTETVSWTIEIYHRPFGEDDLSLPYPNNRTIGTVETYFTIGSIAGITGVSIPSCQNWTCVDDDDWIFLYNTEGNPFSPSTIYTIALVYVPTSAEICSTTFHG